MTACLHGWRRVSKFLRSLSRALNFSLENSYSSSLCGWFLAKNRKPIGLNSRMGFSRLLLLQPTNASVVVRAYVQGDSNFKWISLERRAALCGPLVSQLGPLFHQSSSSCHSSVAQGTLALESSLPTIGEVDDVRSRRDSFCVRETSGGLSRQRCRVHPTESDHFAVVHSGFMAIREWVTVTAQK